MERPTDSHKKTHNVILSPRDTTFGGTVSRLQVRRRAANGSWAWKGRRVGRAGGEGQVVAAAQGAQGAFALPQVAELVGTILINPDLAENKVLEVTSETTAPKLTYQVRGRFAAASTSRLREAARLLLPSDRDGAGKR